MPVTPPVVLTIAGFDPSSGAGITADIKTIAAHECYGVSCITVVTVDSTEGVRRCEGLNPVDPEIVAATLDELLADMTIEAVHIGMLGNEQVVAVVADFLERARLPHIVLDPILKSSSGADLLDACGTRLLIERLLPLAELVTPNQVEAGVMTGVAVPDLDEMRDAAARLHALGAANVVITGGDAPAGPAAGSHPAKAIGILSFTAARGMQTEVFKADRQRSNSTHGTGCAFSTALACHLAHGRGLPEAVLLAKVYVSAAIANAHPLGRGIGPLHHLYRMSQQRRPSPNVAEGEPAHSRN